MRTQNRGASQRKPFIEHLEEFRNLIIKSVLLFLVVFIVIFFFGRGVLLYLVKYFYKGELVFVAPAEPFLVTIKLAAFLALLVVMPFVLNAVLRFFELPRVGLWWACLLFYAGVAFGLFGVMPYGLKFLLSFAKEGLLPMLTYSSIVNFLLTFSIVFGVVFLLPLFLLFLAKYRVLNSFMLRHNRGYIVLLIFVVAALLTPPDVITQLCLALPLIALYETGILLVRLVEKRRAV